METTGRSEKKTTGEHGCFLPDAAGEIFDCFAATPRGAEELTADELAQPGIGNVSQSRGGVFFKSDIAGIYRANLWLRTASRVLVNLAVFPCSSPDELYSGVSSINWRRFLSPDMTFAVHCTLRDSVIRHSGFAALKSKDAVVDQMRNSFGSRPNVDVSNPDLLVNIHLAKNVCTVSLDSSGYSLDHRGYRLERNDAPLRETLAASVIALTEWDSSTPFADPMCGSGTLPIEAALLAYPPSPGIEPVFWFSEVDRL